MCHDAKKQYFLLTFYALNTATESRSAKPSSFGDVIANGGTARPAKVAVDDELNLEIVVESVENKEQAEFLQDIGVDYAQDCLFGKPVTLSFGYLAANN